jgi:hypothetical protein
MKRGEGHQQRSNELLQKTIVAKTSTRVRLQSLCHWDFLTAFVPGLFYSPFGTSSPRHRITSKNDRFSSFDGIFSHSVSSFSAGQCLSMNVASGRGSKLTCLNFGFDGDFGSNKKEKV